MFKQARFLLWGVVLTILIPATLAVLYADDDGFVEEIREAVAPDEPGFFDAGIGTLDDWATLDDETLPGMLEQVQATNSELCAETQMDKLLRVLKESLLAYKRGDAEAILADRLRAAYTIRPDATNWHLALLDKFFKQPDENLPADPEQAMRLLVDRHHFGHNGSGYKDLYNQLSVAGSRIEVYQDNKLPESKSSHLKTLLLTGARKFRDGFITHMPSIEYVNSPEVVIAQETKLLYADVWLAATDVEDHRFLRFRRYYWSPQDDTWLPMEMVSLYARKRKADVFF